MKLIAANAHNNWATGQIDSQTATLANDADPRELSLDGIERIDLNFPKFTDGRAFSQAFLLSRRLGFKGEIRATGDVLVDQLAQMTAAASPPPCCAPIRISRWPNARLKTIPAG